jgi:hypothetical protein
VQWREGDGFVGWAPAGYTDDAYVPDTSWRFVAAASVFAADVPRFYVSANVGGYLRASVPARRYSASRATRPGSGGPSDDWQRRYRVQPRREVVRSGPLRALQRSAAARGRAARPRAPARLGCAAAVRTISSGATCRRGSTRKDEARRQSGGGAAPHD